MDSGPAVINRQYWQMWCDGSALPNPGKMGLGALLISPSGERFELSTVERGIGCNNEAELYALCAALEWAHDKGAKHVEVWSDSDFVVQHLVGSASTTVARFIPLIAQARTSLESFAEVRLAWLPRHRNGEADRLSRQALGLPDKPAAAFVKKNKRRRD